MNPDTQMTQAPPAKNMFSGLIENLFLLLVIAFIAWCLEIVDFFTGNALDFFGIRPRDTSSLMGIVTAHWLHGGIGHLLSNTLYFLMLGGFVLIGGRALFWKVTTFVALVGGGLLWLAGGPGNHLGASLVIFGYLGFLLFRGFFEKSAMWIVISLLILSLYGGMIFGILPSQAQISWEGHLFGFASGVAAAKLFIPPSVQVYRRPVQDYRSIGE